MVRRLFQEVLNSDAVKELTAEMFPEPPQRGSLPDAHQDPVVTTMPSPEGPVTGPVILRKQRERLEPPPPLTEMQPRERGQDVTKVVISPTRPVRRPHLFRIGDIHDLRRAIVIREVLNKPIALRDPQDQIYDPR